MFKSSQIIKSLGKSIDSAKGDKGLLPLLGRMWSWSRVPCFSGAAGALCDAIFVNDDDSRGSYSYTNF